MKSGRTTDASVPPATKSNRTSKRQHVQTKNLYFSYLSFSSRKEEEVTFSLQNESWRVLAADYLKRLPLIGNRRIWIVLVWLRGVLTGEVKQFRQNSQCTFNIYWKWRYKVVFSMSRCIQLASPYQKLVHTMFKGYVFRSFMRCPPRRFLFPC